MVAQSVEQRTENPCVGGSIPPRGTNLLTFSQKEFIIVLVEWDLSSVGRAVDF